MNPQCQKYLFEADANIGDNAHIEPNADGGGVSFGNLLVLCKECHKIIDDNRQNWPHDTLRLWKLNRNKEILQRFTSQFASFEELRTVAVPLLERNKSIFESYGPTGDPLVDQMRHELWLRFEGELISNNQKLEHVLTANEELLHPHNRKIIQDFIAHAREFAQTRDEVPVSRVNLFPEEVNSVFGIERVNIGPISNISPLENFISRLVTEGRFVSLELVPDQIVIFEEEGARCELYLGDRPRVQQVYWSGQFYTPQTNDVPFTSLIFILKWLYERGIKIQWPDVTKVTEIFVAQTYNIKFVYKYLLSDFDAYEVADRKDLIIVNLHTWVDNDVDVLNVSSVSKNGVHVLRQSEFFRFTYSELI